MIKLAVLKSLLLRLPQQKYSAVHFFKGFSAFFSFTKDNNKIHPEVKTIFIFRFLYPTVSFILFIYIILNLSCKNPNKITYRLLEQWKNDDMGCNNIRFNIVHQNFEIFKHFALGKSDRYIFNKLGKPNEQFKEGNIEIISYFAEHGIQCIDSTSHEVDVLRVIIKLQNNTVIDVSKIAP